MCGAAYNEENMPNLCCDAAQFRSMEASLGMAMPFIASCPACMTNMIVRFRKGACAGYSPVI